MENYFGLESLLKTEHLRNKIKNNTDVVVLLVHWSLTSRGFLCSGVGESFLSTDKKSELLPTEWNADASVYSLHYENKLSEKILLKAITADDLIIISLLNVKSEATSDITLKACDYVENLSDVVFKDLDDVLEKVKVELIQKVITCDKTEKDSANKQSKTEEDHNSLKVGGERVNPRMPTSQGPPSLGRSDLDPLGGIMGGGMLMDPRGGGRMGHPMQPRFDPVGPGMGPGPGPLGGEFGIPSGRRGGGQRNFGDAMRPPDWDNMFM